MPRHFNHHNVNRTQDFKNSFFWWCRLLLKICLIIAVISLVIGIPWVLTARRKTETNVNTIVDCKPLPARIPLKQDLTIESAPIINPPKISSYQELLQISKTHMISIEDHYENLVSLSNELAKKNQFDDACGILHELMSGMIMSVETPHEHTELRYKVLNSLRNLNELRPAFKITEAKLQQLDQKMDLFISYATTLFAHDSITFRQQYFMLHAERAAVYLQQKQWILAYAHLKIAAAVTPLDNAKTRELIKTCPQDQLICQRLSSLLPNLKKQSQVIYTNHRNSIFYHAQSDNLLSTPSGEAKNVSMNNVSMNNAPK